MIAYLSKATVQAAIGSVPLAHDLPYGKVMHSAAVLAILMTAPLGATGTDRSYMRLLNFQKIIKQRQALQSHVPLQTP